VIRLVAAAAATLALALPASAAASSPVVVLTSPANPFSTYVGEIMRAEGLNGFDEGAIGTVDLSRYDVAVLGDVPVDPAQAAALASWVAGGGDLIALSPDPDLAGLLGIAPTGGGLDNGYLHAP
jgi:ABC-type sugar transport system substrate-binding protein